MRAICIAILAGLIAISSAHAVDQDVPLTYLTCDGYDAEINMEVRHTVRLYKNTAVFDDENYSLTTNETNYTLMGPLKRIPKVSDLFDSREQIIIDRLDGSYIQYKNGMRTSAFDWSRPNDKGCVVAKPKF